MWLSKMYTHKHDKYETWLEHHFVFNAIFDNALSDPHLICPAYPHVFCLYNKQRQDFSYTLLSDLDFSASEVGLFDVFDAEVPVALGVLLLFVPRRRLIVWAICVWCRWKTDTHNVIVSMSSTSCCNIKFVFQKLQLKIFHHPLIILSSFKILHPYC